MSIAKRIARLERTLPAAPVPTDGARLAVETLLRLGMTHALPDPDNLFWSGMMDLRARAFPNAGPWLFTPIAGLAGSTIRLTNPTRPHCTHPRGSRRSFSSRTAMTAPTPSPPHASHRRRRTRSRISRRLAHRRERLMPESTRGWLATWRVTKGIRESQLAGTRLNIAVRLPVLVLLRTVRKEPSHGARQPESSPSSQMLRYRSPWIAQTQPPWRAWLPR